MTAVDAEPDDAIVARIARAGRAVVAARLQAALEEVAAEQQLAVGSERLTELVRPAVARAGGALWRLALAQAAADELGLELGEAIEHPAVLVAAELLGVEDWAPSQAAPPPDLPAPPLRPLRVDAVHLGGIQTLRPGARNLELHFSDAGLDVFSTADGGSIGRLAWDEITVVELCRPRGRLRRRTSSGPELLVGTDRGEARFELPGHSEARARSELAAVLQRSRAAGQEARR